MTLNKYLILISDIMSIELLGKKFASSIMKNAYINLDKYC